MSEIEELKDEIIDLIIEKQQLNEVIDEARNFVEHYRFYAKINNRDYLKDKNEAGELDEYQVDELLQILDKAKVEDERPN